MDIHRNLPAWFDKVGYIPQQIYLLDDTITNNIAFGLPESEIDRERVREVVRIAQLDAFVGRQPNGMDQIVGENGIRLSGGERQRIGIARALYRDPEILVLDEATSALDNITEALFIDAIAALSKGRTIIMIAHRISTVQNCDIIHYMEGGAITETGSFRELSAKSAKFRALAQIGEAERSVS
jgi:ABC-type multidrug transport system fused ATPase/permease subunit